MREGLVLVIQDVFDRLGLDPVLAKIQPQDEASIATVRPCGFRRAGDSPRNLVVAGLWRDHERWAILSDD